MAIGEVVAAHALDGTVRVRAYQPPAPSLAAGRAVLLEGPQGCRTFTVTMAAPHARGLVRVHLKDVDDRDAAEALIGARVLVHAADLPPPDPEEYYWHELIGARVETVAGALVGEVVETFHTGTNDVWVVRDGEREHLIPVIEDVVRSIDRPARRIVIEPMPGLLD